MNAPERVATAYEPREGSKIARAIKKMGEGPMTARALGQLLDSAPNNIGQMLQPAIDSDLVVKLQDAAGLLHYALSDQLPIAGFWNYHGPSDLAQEPRRPLNTADPFGLLATGAGPEAFAPRSQPEPAVPAKIVTATPAAALERDVRAATPAAANAAARPHFEATFSSSGYLSIRVGETTVRLDQVHQRELGDFTSRFLIAPAGRSA